MISRRKAGHSTRLKGKCPSSVIEALVKAREPDLLPLIRQVKACGMHTTALYEILLRSIELALMLANLRNEVYFIQAERRNDCVQNNCNALVQIYTYKNLCISTKLMLYSDDTYFSQLPVKLAITDYGYAYAPNAHIVCRYRCIDIYKT